MPAGREQRADRMSLNHEWPPKGHFVFWALISEPLLIPLLTPQPITRRE